MPNTSSAQKALRQTIKRTQRNKMVKHGMTVATKMVRKSAAAGTADDARKELIAAQKLIAKAAQKNVIKKNTASRKISRLSKLIAKIK
ncbi:30S ribosomal protein S20 [Candidatus Uhrbacteria bacterium CG10_big_fil_rev_8_21_14_0_10_50_16]|uniref:Small ribosomal subunit protein bS20 n=1 Tax=Candidatus Uhrbacteria bacterium CG10_big_fil_rev_8_21_14_0_10_50_16 TaxID=1975039 RepID=A0A2H0RN40_9BACT|nr:MAG: 30S ribosomal protein S20 [Candidatus Uhrbacteria bacterium CG10_big_fil_rev_8_21_14_0_10_50_16]